MPNNPDKKDLQFEKRFHDFIQINRPRLLAYTLRLLPAGEAEEVIQDAHMKFYSIALAQCEAQRETNSQQQNVSVSKRIDLAQYTPLLFSIAKNLSLSRIRHQQVVTKHQQTSYDNNSGSSISIESSMLERDEKDKLQQAIQSLPPMCKQVFIQRKIHNTSHAEIAKMFNICTKTVESHIARGLKLCRIFMISSRVSPSASHARKRKQDGR